MTILWTPEVLSGFIQSWYDGQDPQSNNRLKFPAVGAKYFQWRNKGETSPHPLLFSRDSEGNMTNVGGGTQFFDLYQPRYMQQSITKLSLVQGGDQMDSSVSGNVIHPEKKLTAVSPATGSACFINYVSNGSAVTSIDAVGASYGYAVGDILEDASGGDGQGSTKATFRVDEVSNRGGFYFNESDSTTNFFATLGEKPINSVNGIGTEVTFFIACNLYTDNNNDTIFKFIDENGEGKDIEILFSVQNDLGIGQFFSRGMKYKNSSGASVTSTIPAFSTTSNLEGRNEIFAIRMSASTAGKLNWFNDTLNTAVDLQQMSFPSDYKLSIMSDGATASEVANKTSRGSVFEILIFKKVLDDEEVDKCVGYLNAKYKLNALQHTHKYANFWPDTSYVAGNPDNGDLNPPSQGTVNRDPVQGDDTTTQPAPFTPPPPNQDPQPVPPAADPTISEITSQNLFAGAHRLSPRQPIQMVSLFLDFCANEYGVNDGASICTAAGSAGSECYNTKFTCQDPTNYLREPLAYRFGNEVGRSLTRFKAYPSIISISTAPVEIIPTKGVSLRAVVTIKLRDFFATGSDVDPYFENRNVIAIENGSYFQKLMKRNPHYIGRTVIVHDGYVDHTGTERFYGGERHYIIDSMSLDNDVMTIKCKDPLTLSDDLKSKVPAPSEFSLGEVLSATGIHSHINLKHNGSSLNGSSSADKLLVTNYFGADNATGFIRINEEILGYTVDVSGSEAALDITSRKQWGTKQPDSDFEVDDTVQKCVFFGTYDGSGTGVTINDVAFELLVNEAGVSETAINNESGGAYSWADERTNWLSSFRIDTILSEPKEVNKQLANIASMVGVNFFYEDKSKQIVMRAETPETDTNTILTITDDDIIEDSLKVINSEKERISRVYYYYNMRDHTLDRDKPKSYKNLFIAIDSDGETLDEYGKESNKVIFGWGVKATSTATSVSQRLLSRFKNTPKTITFKIDASRAVLSTGDHFFISTKHIVNADGFIEDMEMQCLSIKFDSKNQNYIVKAKQFRFGLTNFSQITANDVGGFDKDAADNTSAGFNSVNDASGGTGTELDPYTGVRASESYLADKNHVTLEIVDGGTGWTNGETLVFVPDESAVGADANTRNLIATYTQVGGTVTAVTVTSNVAAGSLGNAVHSGYAANEILTASPASSSGTNLSVRLTKKDRMSGAQEPYLIV